MNHQIIGLVDLTSHTSRHVMGPYLAFIRHMEKTAKPMLDASWLDNRNEREAQTLVDSLKAHLEDPGYADGTFGVLALFEEQVRLLNEMIAEQIPEEVRQEHDLVVVNPDGFQGDERDVIFYSLSYDANGMEQSQISARQAEREHIQGMLNVAFTRARDEIRIFHTAPPEAFGMANGGGAIREWLEHCAAASAAMPLITEDSQLRQTQSEFEAQVLQGLARQAASAICHATPRHAPTETN